MAPLPTKSNFRAGTLALFALALAACTQPVKVTENGGLTLDRAWTAQVNWDVMNRPWFEGNVAYVPEFDGLAKVDLDTGRVVWRDRQPGIVRVGGGVYAWGDYLVVPASEDKPDNLFHYYDTGLAYWTKDGEFLGVDRLDIPSRWNFGVTGADERIFLNAYGGFKAYRLDPKFDATKVKVNATGRLMYAEPAPLTGGPSSTDPNHWVSDGWPFVDGDTIYQVLRPEGASNNAENGPEPYCTLPNEVYNDVPSRIVALDRTTLVVKWTVDRNDLDTFRYGVTPFQRVGDNLLYADPGGFLLLRPADGQVLWHTMDQRSMFSSVGGVSYEVSGNELFVSQLYNAEKNPGEENWGKTYSVAKLTFNPSSFPDERSKIVWGHNCPMFEQLGTNPVVHGGLVYQSSTKGGFVLNADTGASYGRDLSLKASYDWSISTYRYKDLWLVCTADGWQAVKMNLKVGLDGQLAK